MFVLDEVIALRLVVGGSTDIDAGVDAHTVMQWSGHRTESMLRHDHILDLDDLRRVGKQASDYRGPKDNASPPAFGRARLEKSRPASKAPSVRGWVERALSVGQAERLQDVDADARARSGHAHAHQMRRRARRLRGEPGATGLEVQVLEDEGPRHRSVYGVPEEAARL